MHECVLCGEQITADQRRVPQGAAWAHADCVSEQLTLDRPAQDDSQLTLG